MPEEYMSLAERLKQIRSARQKKFNDMMKPVFQRIDQIGKIKRQKEKEEQDLSAIKNIYSEDINKLNADVKEYSREEFGSPRNYEKYIRSRIQSVEPAYEKSQKIQQLQRDVIDTYGEEALQNMDVNETSTIADWKREVNQLESKYKEQRQWQEDEREMDLEMIEKFGADKVGDIKIEGRPYSDLNLPEKRTLLAQMEYNRQNKQGTQRGKTPETTEEEVDLHTNQKQELLIKQEKYDIEPKDDVLSKLRFLELTEEWETIKEDIKSGELFGGDKKRAEDRLREINKEISKYVKQPPKKEVNILERAGSDFYAPLDYIPTTREKELGTSFKNKKPKEESEASWRDYQ